MSVRVCGLMITGGPLGRLSLTRGGDYRRGVGVSLALEGGKRQEGG